MSDSADTEKFNNRSGGISRRRLIKLGGLSGALATISPGFAKAATLLSPGRTSNAISPIMEQLTAYMTAASTRALPEEAVEKAKHHIFATFPPMISVSRLPPGPAPLDFSRPS